MSELPTGTVTFLFIDVEGSTRLLQQLGERYGEVVRDYRTLVRKELGDSGGTEIDTQGDAFFFSFRRAREAVAGAVAAQRALAAHEWPDGAELRARIGLHTGEPAVGEEGYLGLDVVRAARICSAGHGGQILLSETTRALVGNDLPDGAHMVDLGRQNLKDIQHERVFQLALDDGPHDFPPLRGDEGDGESVKSRADRMAESFERRIEAYVERTIEESLTGALSGEAPKGVPGAPTKILAGLAGVGVFALVLLAAAIVGIVLLVKFVFF